MSEQPKGRIFIEQYSEVAQPKPGLLFKPWKRKWISSLPVGADFQTRRLGKVRCEVGDLLYHREPLYYGIIKTGMVDDVGTEYTPDGAFYSDSDRYDPVIPLMEWRWKRNCLSQMHMPREAARLWYRVVAIREERLRDIDHDDALAEGIVQDGVGGLGQRLYTYPGANAKWNFPQTAFLALWDSINAAKASAETNPTVTVYTLRIERRKP